MIGILFILLKTKNSTLATKVFRQIYHVFSSIEAGLVIYNIACPRHIHSYDVFDHNDGSLKAELIHSYD